MTVVRAVLLLVLCTVGGWLGLKAGTYYLSIDTIKAVLGGNQRLGTLSQFGFMVIGVLAGGLLFGKVIAYVTHLANQLKEMPVNDKIALILGGMVGLAATALLQPMVNQIEPSLRLLVIMGIGLVMVYLTTQAAMSMREELRLILPHATAPEDKHPLKYGKILDTNIIIDGRITDIVRSGFIEGTLYVPGFVLDELQTIADSGDSLKRARGRRGLDLLNAMQKEFNLLVRNHDHVIGRADGEPVDSRLVRLAKALDATIVTNDFNLNKVAELQGVRVLNVNELANALKPVVLVGEDLTVQLTRAGREPGQAVAYLDDGTMVVVENARDRVGETVTVVVASLLQTTAGKMIFSNLREVAEQEQERLDRNIRSYYRDRDRRRDPRDGSGPERRA